MVFRTYSIYRKAGLVLLRFLADYHSRSSDREGSLPGPHQMTLFHGQASKHNQSDLSHRMCRNHRSYKAPQIARPQSMQGFMNCIWKLISIRCSCESKACPLLLMHSAPASASQWSSRAASHRMHCNNPHYSSMFVS